MRISDWSSDVCSSDLMQRVPVAIEAIEQDEPGECPKCGMALEPITVSAEEKNPELIEMTRRFWVGAGLTVPVLLLARGRSEERRVGKESVRTCRSGWRPEL